MNGKGDTPRPLSVTPATYAANYARIRWTEEPEGYDPREKLCPPLEDPRETMRQRHLAEARKVVFGQSCADRPPSLAEARKVVFGQSCADRPPSHSLPHITPEGSPCQ